MCIHAALNDKSIFKEQKIRLTKEDSDSGQRHSQIKFTYFYLTPFNLDVKLFIVQDLLEFKLKASAEKRI